MSTITRPALRYHGGKFRLAPWVMQFFPKHHRYVEPFGGAAGVLLRKERSYAEVYNDLDSDIANFFRVLRDEGLRSRLIEACQLTPYARNEWQLAYEPTDEPVERARRTAVRAAMGFGSAGATKESGGFRIDTARAFSTAMHNWATYPACLGAIGARFEAVLIENRPAIDVMRQHDAPDTLHFVDPPYLPETRQLGGNRYYRHELNKEQHAELLEALRGLQGFVVLSGYPSPLYLDSLADWTMHTTQARIAAHRGTGMRTEAVWLNPACSRALHSAPGSLFTDH
ncbi:DNA adenine methylase [Comamonas terrae]|uniref:DNA adenine methylase n=1 Tax=Comamonas terrae TaxID=673548 RepID=A0ABW5UQJ2_9BURK|nr:DNA adenine methylase [Comamonas terrae]